MRVQACIYTNISLIKLAHMDPSHWFTNLPCTTINSSMCFKNYTCNKCD